MSDELLVKADWSHAFQVSSNPDTGNYEIRVIGRMPTTFVCSDCGREDYGHVWSLGGEKIVCSTCAMKPIK
jgi:hypothetical protein